MRGVCISQITHLCGIRPLRLQNWLKNVKLRRCYALRMGSIWPECVFERGRLFTAFEKDNVRSVLTTRWEFFYFLFFARLFHQILRYLYKQPKKKLAKNLLWWRKIAKLKTIDHNWTTQVSFRMSEENTAGCQVIADNFHSTRKKISSLSTKALFPWNSLSKSASDRLIFISVLNILGMGQLKERERMKYYTKMEEDENSEYLLADL